ncbi:MAG TPA: acetyl-CoA carboxylase carboxyltransferase subunit alpha [Treponema sp.]|jgi:acetyl-CoA carboxylase carboxyl transferase subunit alpha|uniref:acetyl-CoA carboxylase carboxyltransferase subunit alpha n=1 Tax=Gracilinema caldarium TaxID=215591 RepID=UPI0026ED8194|nr:acetyl-CoA carboxylase carboxyltransferase subunit alpha [Gracilinema caldarium]HON13398.1 acetyl-CoA carboxylase carboxyltransferase subunit alpha [Treponema sp.]HPC70901.1 acetyl-CoA carboxylase carboxyltransferase subunit alpha [Treponema sp.]HRS03972.1 acetyl-CoA carboxylase carboxyltransferase subunit alpha [Treponema sp.]HRU27974.1 acetyl-CoA carboxylase carboxyltransferase subunit alpha [Treponema sp.]
MPHTTALTKKLEELKKLAEASGIDVSDELTLLESKVKAASKTEMAWRRVELARHPDRPYALDYITRIFDNFIELHGDRYFGDDAAIVGGLGFLNGQPVTIIANQKGRSLKENMKRNHGMANPEGYRKALRLAKQAEKFHRPIITFVDTSGAYPGLGAEERGIGEAIARNLMEFSQLKTPIISIIIGEGGSGGALGISVGDKIYMLENAVYSVISPEGCASILLRDASRAKDAAAMLRITSNDLLEFKIVNGIIQEPEGGAHTDPDATAQAIKKVLVRDLQDLCDRPPAVLVRYRNQKIRKIGHWNEGDA